MADENPIDDMVERISAIKRSAVELRNLSLGIQAIDCNVERILASVKMLEINVSDISDITDKKNGKALRK